MNSSDRQKERREQRGQENAMESENVQTKRDKKTGEMRKHTDKGGEVSDRKVIESKKKGRTREREIVKHAIR